MITSVLNPSSDLLGILKVIAFYSGGEVEAEVTRFVESYLESRGNTLADEGQELVAELHALFLRNGDRDEYRQQYCADAFKWYMASCVCSFVEIRKQELICHQVGGIHIYHQRGELLTLLSPIHNVQSELAAHTIEESCLAPFESRTNAEIAQQVLMDSPQKLVNQLASLSRADFYEKLGHLTTRAIGYYPSPHTSEIGTYRLATPLASIRTTRIQPGDSIHIYIPRGREAIEYSAESVQEKTRAAQQLPASPISVSQHLPDGHLLSANVSENYSFAELMTRAAD